MQGEQKHATRKKQAKSKIYTWVENWEHCYMTTEHSAAIFMLWAPQQRLTLISFSDCDRTYMVSYFSLDYVF